MAEKRTSQYYERQIQQRGGLSLQEVNIAKRYFRIKDPAKRDTYLEEHPHAAAVINIISTHQNIRKAAEETISKKDGRRIKTDHRRILEPPSRDDV